MGATVLLVLGALLAVAIRGDGVQVVLSDSMDPAIPRGALVLSAPDSSIEAGDVIVFDSPGLPNLVTHRVVIIEASGKGVRYTTQGDANEHPDARPVEPEDVRGTVRVVLPHVGGALASLDGPAGVGVLLGPPLAAAGLGVLRSLAAKVRHRPARGDVPRPIL